MGQPTLLVGLLLASDLLLGDGSHSTARYKTEAEAIAAGRELGIGSARLEGPRTAVVLTHETWKLVYTAGRAGIQPGGGLRLAMRHVHCWSPPQTKNPVGAGYLTAGTSTGAEVKVTPDRARALFSQYHPWQNIVEVAFPEGGLAAGDTLRVTYGDRGKGSPGIRVQPFDESRFVFKVYVDALGNGHYLPLAENPAIEIVAAEPYRLGAVLPSDAVIGKPTWCIVRAEDRYGNPAVSYRGAVRLQSSDPDATLPAVYTFTAADRGVHRFDDIVFRSAGHQSVTVDDGAFRRSGNPVKVTPRQPDLLLLWGDLHGHTLYSDGRGTVEEFYDFAERVAGLDFCAVTDHAFEVMDEMWTHSKLVTNRAYKPGRFVTFQAYEWSGLSGLGGDHNVYFLDEDPPLYRSLSYYDPRNLQMDHGPLAKINHVEDLFAKLKEHLRKKDVFCIPHYGGRRGNHKWHEPKVQRLIEVFSEHRRSEDWATPFLEKRYRLGIIASTDNHFGNPGHGYLKPTYDWNNQEIGMAAVAVYASERTRESIFQALYDRRVYATSGDRIILDVSADGHVMGSEFRTATPPTLTVTVVGTAAVTKIEVKKDSKVVHVVKPQRSTVHLEWRDPDFEPQRECYYYVRVVQANDEEAISSPIWVN